MNDLASDSTLIRPSPAGATSPSLVDRAILGGMLLLTLAMFSWFALELARGLGQVPENLDGPGLFRAFACISCHERSPQAAPGRGPSLYKFEARARERAKIRAQELGRELSAAAFVMESITEPEASIAPGYSGGLMRPVRMSPQQLGRLTAYILERPETDPEILKALALFAPEQALQTAPAPGDPARGRGIYFGKGACDRCHSLEPGPSKLLGPSLQGVAAYSLEYLEESLVEPSARILPAYQAFLVLGAGLLSEARLSIERWPGEKEPGLLSLLDAQGTTQRSFRRLHVLNSSRATLAELDSAPAGVVELHESAEGRESFKDSADEVWIEPAAGSLMPAYADVLSASEREDLIAFLKNLK